MSAILDYQNLLDMQTIHKLDILGERGNPTNQPHFWGVKEPYLFSMQIAQLGQRGVILQRKREERKPKRCKNNTARWITSQRANLPPSKLHIIWKGSYLKHGHHLNSISDSS